MRLDIPKFIQDHNLFETNGVCKTKVLYTDPDIILANKITQIDIHNLMQMMGELVAMYGRQYLKKAHIQNSGVMVMNARLFQNELPLMLDHIGRWGKEKYKKYTEYGVHDQSLVNNYRGANDMTMKKFTQLPIHYDWTPYWGLEPSSFEQVKIIHFHGPKPGRVLDELGKCNLTWDKSLEGLWRPYKPLFDQGVCCDQGRTADWSLKAMDVLRPQTNSWD